MYTSNKTVMNICAKIYLVLFKSYLPEIAAK